MLTDADRARRFWLGCIPLRLAIAWAALLVSLYAPAPWRRAFAGYAALTALGFAYNIWLAARGRKTHGGFGGRVWWGRLRYAHAALWGGCAAALWLGAPWAGLLLAGDVGLAIVAGAAVRRE